MPPSSPHISSQLRQLVYYHLDNNLIRNAIFVAGRLHAFEPRSSEAAYLLSLCHLLGGQSKAAWEISRNSGSRGTHLGCSYVYAQACLDLGRYMEGITALERSRPHWILRNNWNKHSESRRQNLPDAAAVLSLQGRLWKAHKDVHKAVDCYVEALKLNPFLWDAFLGLCETGANVRVPNIYKMSPEMLAILTTSPSADNLSSFEKGTMASGPLQVQPNSNINADPFFALSSREGAGGGSSSSALWEKLNGNSMNVISVGSTLIEGLETPVPQSDSDDVRTNESRRVGSEPFGEPPLAPARKPRSMQVLGLEYDLDPPPKMKSTVTRAKTRSRVEAEEGVSRDAPAPLIMDRKRTVSGHIAPSSSSQSTEPGCPQRRSVRLFNQIRPAAAKISVSASALSSKDSRDIKKIKSTGIRTRSASGTSTTRTVSGSRKAVTEPMEIDKKEAHNGNSVKNTAPDRSKEVEALGWTLDLFSKLAGGYSALSSYRCQESIQIFNSLPQTQRETPWTLTQIGRAYYEQAQYAEAEKYFLRVRTIAPHSLESMEVYSTVLWHLKNAVELAYLAHELMEIDRLSPQAWCAIGNSFSLEGDHDQALKCFRRATQVDPRFSYAFTLQGHEFLSNEEHDKAMDAYRHAIGASSRHYNAWYGMGKVYEKMGKFQYAEQHYQMASKINPTNVVLICCIGLILERIGDQKGALLQYSRACSLSPQSVVPRLRKARALLKLHDLKAAHGELRVLKDLAPDEPNVHYLLGKFYKMMHDKGNAIKHFTTALNLDPKAAHFVKDAMESLENPDDFDEDMS
ncbi:anaphase-promoting complex subunit cdc27 [Ophidiomyces ophidiicola]|uniref:Anaphase-promoting complex subunit cdc27 n=1 Tax=Ophidiomyces ophidiicola TaxID=1387563 RepID=A0ACB8V297_9EURO|nr:anaphase-promoting complex subunit cdc27 [Ophidiomyces ophidiicola]KAI1917711.1 anaphase-promoting complex subunit cdc27 [Ophidiomyces ophidiicola]KAI1919391.1 anaphase-promoting complex subunit cdc27 [Ophidiomyces ophidiicola]KAI1928365.1 anaphase-promoting complex subunit cdc27 [Ophidiomyces ophidiicola]KAI1951238.1 anaphase-promoting complex subunit cdc27 [Ophidiomyces ophidiicola]KAI1953619.1 anaphase-promoting complex subunit cdc27 [Ophidiomyces ophidiicola]